MAAIMPLRREQPSSPPPISPAVRSTINNDSAMAVLASVSGRYNAAVSARWFQRDLPDFTADFREIFRI